MLDPATTHLRVRECGTQVDKKNSCWAIRDFCLTLPVIQGHAQRGEIQRISEYYRAEVIVSEALIETE